MQLFSSYKRLSLFTGLRDVVSSTSKKFTKKFSFKKCFFNQSLWNEFYKSFLIYFFFKKVKGSKTYQPQTLPLSLRNFSYTAEYP